MFMRGYTRKRQKDYDDRTGAKVDARRLKEDGEITGFYTTQPDPEHPQARPYIPGPDISQLVAKRPPPHKKPVTVVPGVNTSANLWDAPTYPYANVRLNAIPVEIGGTLVGGSHGA